MTKRAIITAKQLEQAGACEEPVALFREIFGERTIVTPTKARKVADKFHWTWAADDLLSPAAREEYDRVEAEAWEEYDLTTSEAWGEYRRAKAVAWDEYLRVKAEAFAKAYIKDNQS